MYSKFIIRDASIVIAAMLLWWGASSVSAGQGMLADLSGFACGLMVGIAAYVLHEWGHVVAALASGSLIYINANTASPFMFSYDSRQNSLKQFVIMSLGGFAVTAAVLGFTYGYLPEPLLATRVARGAAMFLTFLLVVLELPLLLFALATRSVPAAAGVKVE